MTPGTDTPSPSPELRQKHRKMWASGDYPSMVETFLAAARSAPGRGLRDRTRRHVLDVAAGTGNAAIPAAKPAPTSSPAT